MSTTTAPETGTTAAVGECHIVEQGDTLLRIGEQFGQAWEVIWKHPKNRGLRDHRVHPHMLSPGDRVFVPPRALREEAVQADGALRFTKSTNRAVLRVRIEDADGEPLAHRPCRLRAGREETVGTTDAQGMLEHEIAADAELGCLRLDGTSGEQLEFLQPALLSPQVGCEHSTVRAYYRTPLDPDFTACMRLNTRRLIISCRELLAATTAEDTDDQGIAESLRTHLDANANRIRVAAATELGADWVARSAGSRTEDGQPQQDEMSRRLPLLSERASRRAEKARRAADGDSIRPRGEQDPERLERRVQEALKDWFKGRRAGLVRPGRTTGGEGIDRLANCAARVAADYEGHVPKEAARTVRAYLLDMLDRNVQRAGHRLQRDVRRARQRLDETTAVVACDTGADDAAVATRVADRCEALLGEALQVLGADAERLGRRHELLADRVVDVLLTEGRRLIREIELLARARISEQARQASPAARQTEAPNETERQTPARSIDRDVAAAYDQLHSCGVAPGSPDTAAGQLNEAETQAQQQARASGSTRLVALREEVARSASAAGSADAVDAPDPRHHGGADGPTAEAEPMLPDTGGTRHDGTPDDDGQPCEQIPVRIGHLDPINTLSGVIGRLNNLGFDAGPPAAFMGEYTRQAVRRFQYVEGLSISGEVDAAVLGRLLERHGC